MNGMTCRTERSHERFGFTYQSDGQMLTISRRIKGHNVPFCCAKGHVLGGKRAGIEVRKGTFDQTIRIGFQTVWLDMTCRYDTFRSVSSTLPASCLSF